MKIGFEAKRIFHNRTGLGNYSRDLVKALAKYFPENEYYLYNPKPGRTNLFLTKPPLEEKLPKRSISRIFPNLWRQRQIVGDLESDKIQLFHGLSGEIPAGLPKRGIKSVVTIHDLIFLRYPEFYSYFDRKIHERKFMHAAQTADVIVAVSEQTKMDIIHFFGTDPSKIKVIYQGCHPSFKVKYTQEDYKETRQKLSLPEKFILNVGTIESRKNILIAVKAIRNIDTHLVIVGSETEYAKIVKKYIAEHQLESKVTFLKNLTTKELATLNQMAQLVIYPSFFEGFGIPIIEALYSRTPVITTRDGCFPEAGGPDSIYIDPTDADEVGQKIQLVLSDPELRKSMAINGHAYAQQFNEENIANNMMSLYQSLMK